ncbi:MAG: selenium-dependent molybdenum cofactor biosynthesis protein YqeB [Thermodesulfobacteriota bacterium]|nr:selenium-dependent molybdenum cofactor biosynthesis protein YqeB [Thermodesulfobacteriota bacterium]
MNKLSDLKILIKGGGEQASGVAHRLFCSNFKVCITEIPNPKAVRREVAFCEAIYEGEKEIEGVAGRLIKEKDEIFKLWEERKIPVLIDPEAKIRGFLKPDVIVDAIMAKKNLGITKISDAPFVIGLGPGFTAAKDVHVVIETNRGHNLGRVILQREAEKHTGIPGVIGGYSSERVFRAPKEGKFIAEKKIGDFVKTGDIVGWVADKPVKSQINGIIRGLIRDGFEVGKNLKLGDVDPRGFKEFCYTISDKARAIAGGVLEGILKRFNI